MGIFGNWLGKKDYFDCYAPILRTRTLQGISFPCFIQKEGNYIFSDFELFEDGIFYCGDFVDFALLKDRLTQQWLNYYVPAGEKLTIPRLGSIVVNEPKWIFKDDKAFLKLVKKYLKTLNPSLKNLYNFFGENTHEVNKIKVPVFKRNTFPVLEEETSQINIKQIEGKSTTVFYQEKGQTFLAQISVFKNGTIKIHRVPDTLIGAINELENMFEEGALKTTLLNEESISILGLGEFTATAAQTVTANEKIHEIKQLYKTLNQEELSK